MFVVGSERTGGGALQSLWKLADYVLGPEAVLSIVKHELNDFLSRSGVSETCEEALPLKSRRRSQLWFARNAAKRSAKRGRDDFARPNDACR